MIALALLSLSGFALYFLATSKLVEEQRKLARVEEMGRRVDEQLKADDSIGYEVI